jgi:cytochrome c oxidase accessory protein FixG
MHMEESAENFRDKISTVDQQGRRIWIYPKKPSGRLSTARGVVSILLLAFMFLAPLMRINGQPLLLFDVLERRFVIFGMIFWPQDFYLFVLASLALIVFIVLFTVVFGRVWCGWTCPQTIFMEMVFRKVEYWIEGDARNQIELNRAPWTFSKFLKKSFKHLIFYGLSFIIGNTFLAYFIGTDRLFSIITDPPAQHLAGLTIMILFSSVFYWVFAFFREQVCTLVCPYGRLQGVLLDQNSVVVAYDFKRGEPRGKIRRGKNQHDHGDCIDCLQCVDVCPTGIDIRNGTQLECINCTACIDACNHVMEKIRRPKGLIRYASYNSILEGRKFGFTPRVIGYAAVFLLLITLTGVLFAARKPIDITILRTPGMMYQQIENGYLANLYNLKIINKTNQDKDINIRLKSPEGRIKVVGGNLNVAKNNFLESAFFVEIPAEKIRYVQTPVILNIYTGDQLIDEVNTSFIGPDPYNTEEKK